VIRALRDVRRAGGGTGTGSLAHAGTAAAADAGAALGLLVLYPAWYLLPGTQARFLVGAPLGFLFALFWPFGQVVDHRVRPAGVPDGRERGARSCRWRYSWRCWRRRWGGGRAGDLLGMALALVTAVAPARATAWRRCLGGRLDLEVRRSGRTYHVDAEDLRHWALCRSSEPDGPADQMSATQDASNRLPAGGPAGRSEDDLEFLGRHRVVPGGVPVHHLHRVGVRIGRSLSASAKSSATRNRGGGGTAKLDRMGSSDAAPSAMAPRHRGSTVVRRRGWSQRGAWGRRAEGGDGVLPVRGRRCLQDAGHVSPGPSRPGGEVVSAGQCLQEHHDFHGEPVALSSLNGRTRNGARCLHRWLGIRVVQHEASRVSAASQQHE
jgi:hypothetical protein